MTYTYTWSASSLYQMLKNTSVLKYGYLVREHKMEVEATALSVTTSQTPVPTGVPQRRVPVTVGRTTSTMHTVNHTANEDLTSFFECPVCFDYVLPPIIQVQHAPFYLTISLLL